MSCLAVWWHLAGPELLCNVTVSAGEDSPAGLLWPTPQHRAVFSDQACPRGTIVICCLSAMPRDPRFSDYMYRVCFLPYFLKTNENQMFEILALFDF